MELDRLWSMLSAEMRLDSSVKYRGQNVHNRDIKYNVQVSAHVVDAKQMEKERWRYKVEIKTMQHDYTQ